MLEKACSWVLISLAAVLAAGCASPTPVPSPSPTSQASPAVVEAVPAQNKPTPTFAPDTPQVYLTPGAAYGSGGLIIGNVFLEKTSISYDTKIGMPVITLSGNLPTPCNKLQVQVEPPDKQKQIQVRVFSLIDPQIMCAQVLQPFTKPIPLAGLQPGAYEVQVNGKAAGTANMP